jgi:hypothetical protein
MTPSSPEERITHLEGLVRDLAQMTHQLAVGYRALQLLLAERGVMTSEDVEARWTLVVERLEEMVEFSFDPDVVAFRRRRRQMEGGEQAADDR